jgi:apolipoprotein N-acyltransferase
MPIKGHDILMPMLFLRKLSGGLLSAIILIVSYPQIEWWPLAWVALVPLLFVLDHSISKGAWWFGFLFGFLFFFGTLGWLVHVTYPGAVILSLYLALFTGIFGLSYIYFRKFPLIPRVLILSCVWTVLEYLRAHLFTGFGWVTLGHSQYKNLLMIQIADIIGLYGISFLVILVNLMVFESIRFVNDSKEIRRLQMIVLAVLLGSLMYGLGVFQFAKFPSTVKVSVIQPNIAQQIKWEERYMPLIVQGTLNLSEQAAQDKPDLILWPETSLPGVFSEEPAYVQQIQLKAMDLKTPLMMGAILNEKDHYYNSAILIGKDGRMVEHYNKIHLVPFGEFLPLRPILGWLNKYIGLEDFTSGDKYTLFPIQTTNKFGVLICFEDALNYLWRNFTKAGAEVLVNITNDAWFMDTKEPFLHLQCAVMQCVMNKRSLVRAANTGVSGFIDPLGRIIGLAHDRSGKQTFVTTFATGQVPLNKGLTFYTKYADVFTYLCFACILWGILGRKKYV